MPTRPRPGRVEAAQGGRVPGRPGPGPAARPTRAAPPAPRPRARGGRDASSRVGRRTPVEAAGHHREDDRSQRAGRTGRGRADVGSRRSPTRSCGRRPDVFHRGRLPNVPLDFRIAGLGHDAVEYLAAWDLQRERPRRRGQRRLPRHRAPAGAPAGVHRRQAHRCRTSVPLDPGGAPVIDVDRGGKITFHGPGQLVGYPIVALPDHVKVVDFVRRVEEALIARLRRLRRRDRAGARSQRRLAARRRPRPRAQDRGDRDPGEPRRDHARVRAQLRRRPRLVRPVRPVRHLRRRGHLAQPASWAATSPSPRSSRPSSGTSAPTSRGRRTPRRPTTSRAPSRPARRASNWSPRNGQDPPHGGSGDRDIGSPQGVPHASRRPARRRREPRPRRPGRRRPRLPRTQRVGQDHHDPDAARTGARPPAARWRSSGVRSRASCPA